MDARSFDVDEDTFGDRIVSAWQSDSWRGEVGIFRSVAELQSLQFSRVMGAREVGDEHQQRICLKNCMQQTFFIPGFNSLHTHKSIVTSTFYSTNKEPKCLILRELPPRKAGTSIHHSTPDINTGGGSTLRAERSAKRGDDCIQEKARLNRIVRID